MIKYCLNVRSDTNIYENEQGKDIFNQNGTDVMDDIQVASSENSSQSCIQLSYNAEQLFQVDELSQLSFSKNPNPSEQKLQTEDTPTYNQILSLTNAIIQKYPHLSITKIANYLYEKLIPVEKKYKTDHDPPKQ